MCPAVRMFVGVAKRSMKFQICFTRAWTRYEMNPRMNSGPQERIRQESMKTNHAKSHRRLFEAEGSEGVSRRWKQRIGGWWATSNRKDKGAAVRMKDHIDGAGGTALQMPGTSGWGVGCSAQKASKGKGMRGQGGLHEFVVLA